MKSDRLQLNIQITQAEKERLRLIMAMTGNRSMVSTLVGLINDKAEQLGVRDYPASAITTERSK